ncbi:MAG: putative transposase [Phycisphaerae bacterium]
MIQNALIMPEHGHDIGSETRWFSIDSCAVYHGETCEVFVGGHLAGTFGPRDVLARNILLVGLADDRSFRKGALARAFKVSHERLRQIRLTVAREGLSAIPAKPRGGRARKLNDDVVVQLERLFDRGLNAHQAFVKEGKKLDLSYRSICRVHSAWKERRAEAATESSIALPSDGPGDEELSGDEGLAVAPVRSGKMVQHAGGLLLVALLHSYGLHEAAMRGWEASGRWKERLRMAIDAVVLALGIGRKCVEGVRRLETKTAPLLLRTNHAPSESWVRRIIKRYVDGGGMANKLHLRMTGVYLDSARSAEDAPAVFYVDNHMRSYTGKQTIRKGWRMQDKRAVPGVTDYYVHDEDGRPVFRVEAPSHDSLCDWLSPIAELMRGGLDDKQRILLAFDRAGAFPENMAQLRDTGVEFVTYERKPYRKLPKSAFTEKVKLEDGEVFLVHEKRLANLGKKRGRVRRISLLTDDGRQINLLAVSKEPAWRLIEIITGRWVQENGFKHGKERWGLNQLDRRKTVDYAPGTIIPNPARRRLEFSFKLADAREGKLRNKLAALKAGSPNRAELKADLEQCVALKTEIKAQRPSVPTHIPLEDSELAGELTYHDPHYKTVIDTIRIACANAESELALNLADHLRKPLEAKKVLANIFESPGDIRVNEKSITIALHLTGRKDERDAADHLFRDINDWNLTLPGDSKNLPLRFKSQV